MWRDPTRLARRWQVAITYFIFRKLGGAAATMLTVSFLVFLALEVNVADVAVKVLGQFSTEPNSEQPGCGQWLQ